MNRLFMFLASAISCAAGIATHDLMFGPVSDPNLRARLFFTIAGLATGFIASWLCERSYRTAAE